MVFFFLIRIKGTEAFTLAAIGAMKNQFIKGTLVTLIYYLLGAALTLLAYLLYEDTYTLERASHLHHLVLTGTWIGGCLWALFGLYKYLRGQRKYYYLGIVVINLAVLFAIFMWVYLQPSPAEETMLLIPKNIARAI